MAALSENRKVPKNTESDRKAPSESDRFPLRGPAEFGFSDFRTNAESKDTPRRRLAGCEQLEALLTGGAS